jgi:hypothetical protein
MASWQRVKFNLPESLPIEIRRRIADDIITRIQERAISENRGFKAENGGDGTEGREIKFPDYTKQYAAKKGTSRGNVDLVLSSDMFNAMGLVSSTARSITIGFERGSDENAKAEGNQIGSYGRDPNPRKARPFLGLSKSDLDQIVSKYVES